MADSAKPEGSDSMQEDVKSTKQRRKYTKVQLVTIVISVLAASYFGRFVAANLFSSDDSGSDVLTSEEIEPYVSVQHGFTASFPGFPAQESDILNVEGVEVPFSYYSSDKKGPNNIYAVSVTDYSLINDTFNTDAGLEGAINGSAQNTNATINSTEYRDYQGYRAITANYTTVQNGQESEINNYIIAKDRIFYSIFTIGESADDFNAFVESFRFN